MGAPLRGIRVFDLTAAGVGPWATLLLAGLGADVIHVEGEGRSSEHVPPLIRGTSCLYIAANHNKRSLLLDLKNAHHRRKAYELLGRCDVFVENFRAGVAERLGLGYEEVRRVRPDIIYCSLNGWGKTGPMAQEVASDPVLQAFSGWASINDAPGGPGQVYRHLALLDVTTASYGALAILGALLHRKRTGEGQHIETSMLGSALSVQATRLAEYFATGRQPPNLGSASSTTVPHQAFSCADRHYLAVGVVRQEEWPRFCRAIERPDLAQDPRFATNADRVRHRDVLVPLLEQVFQQKHSLWWTLRLARERVPHARFMEFEHLRFHPQIVANDFLKPVDTPHWGRICFGGWPWTLDSGAEPIRPGPVPGEHTQEILQELGLDQAQAQAVSVAAGGNPGGAGRGFLAGYRILELGQDVSAAYCGFLLAALGADVVKLEPSTGDPARRLGPPLDGGESTLFATLNLHKRSVALDWTTPRGQDVLRRLVAHADLFIEGLGPGAAGALGIDYATLRPENPRLVYCGISAFGEAGPLGDMPGAELPLQAFAEYTSALGVLGNPPVRVGTDFGGVMTGVMAAQAIIAALVQREETGKGQRVSTSVLGTLMHLRGIMWVALSNPDQWYGFHLESYTREPDQGYRVKDGRIFFRFRMRQTAEDQERFHRLLDHLGMEKYKDDPRFDRLGWEAAGSTARYYGELKPVWEQALAALTLDEAIRLIKEGDGEAFPFNDYPRVVGHLHTRHMGLVQQGRTVGGTALRYIRPPWNLSTPPSVTWRPAPVLGEHTDDVLREARVSEEEILELRRDGIVR